MGDLDVPTFEAVESSGRWSAVRETGYRSGMGGRSRARVRRRTSSFRGWKPSPSVRAHPTARWCRIDLTLPREAARSYPDIQEPRRHGAPATDRYTLEAAVDNASERPRSAREPRSIVLGLHDLQLGRAIRVGIEEQGLLEVVGAASTAEGLVELSGLVHPDVILVDEVLATTEAARVDALRAACDAAVIVLLEGGGARRLPFPAGATAYLDLRPVDELVSALADVATIAVELGVVGGFGARSA